MDDIFSEEEELQEMMAETHSEEEKEEKLTVTETPSTDEKQQDKK